MNKGKSSKEQRQDILEDPQFRKILADVNMDFSRIGVDALSGPFLEGVLAGSGVELGNTNKSSQTVLSGRQHSEK